MVFCCGIRASCPFNISQDFVTIGLYRADLRFREFYFACAGDTTEKKYRQRFSAHHLSMATGAVFQYSNMVRPEDIIDLTQDNEGEVHNTDSDSETAISNYYDIPPASPSDDRSYLVELVSNLPVGADGNLDPRALLQFYLTLSPSQQSVEVILFLLQTVGLDVEQDLPFEVLQDTLVEHLTVKGRDKDAEAPFVRSPEQEERMRKVAEDKALLEEQDREYQESLRIDQEKERIRQEEEAKRLAEEAVLKRKRDEEEEREREAEAERQRWESLSRQERAAILAERFAKKQRTDGSQHKTEP
jgi:hypothetical protein